MTTTDRAAYIAHDTKLYELLADLTAAHTAVDTAEAAVLRAAAGGVYVSHTGRASIIESCKPSRYCDVADLPVGTIYWLAKTFNRGEGDRAYTVDEPVDGRPRRHITRLSEARSALPDGSKAVAKLDEALAATRAAAAAVTEHEKGYTGWSRYFLVVSSSGHVHRSMSCSTCYPSTGYAPLVDLSGLDEATAVAEVGETLCSVCFPDAPVNGRPSKLTAAKARKLAAAGVES